MTEDELFVALHRMVRSNLTAWQAVVLFVIDRHPGASYTDIANMIDKRGDGYRRYGKFVRHLISHGLVDDHRVRAHARTAGRLHISDEGRRLLDRITEGL